MRVVKQGFRASNYTDAKCHVLEGKRWERRKARDKVMDLMMSLPSSTFSLAIY